MEGEACFSEMQIQDRAGAYGEEKRRIFAQQKKDKKRIKKNCVQPEAYGRTVKVRWGYLMLLGILFSLEVAAFSANAQELQPERMQAIKEGGQSGLCQLETGFAGN